MYSRFWASVTVLTQILKYIKINEVHKSNYTKCSNVPRWCTYWLNFCNIAPQLYADLLLCHPFPLRELGKHGVMAGDRGGQDIGPPHLINWSVNLLSIKCLSLQAHCYPGTACCLVTRGTSSLSSGSDQSMYP